MSKEKVLSDNNIEEVDSEHEMTFMEHLEELRWRIIYMVIGILVGAILCFVFIDFLVEKVLLQPAVNSGAQLQNLKPFGQIFLYFQVAIMGGIIISIPNIFLQIWKFISPALEKHEKKYILAIVMFSSLCFLSGIVFAYFVMLPLTMDFAAHFGTEAIKNEFAIDEYMAIIFSVMLAAGLIFELPMISFFLTKLGILTPDFMRKYRKHAIVAIMFFAALLSPGTDPVSQIVLAVPLFFLYEISIFISKITQKKS